MDVDVDFSQLHDAGLDSARIATDVRHALRRLDVIAGVAVAVPGGNSGSAASLLYDSWSTESEAVSAELESYADNLIESAKCYRETEEQAVQLARNIMGDL